MTDNNSSSKSQSLSLEAKLDRTLGQSLEDLTEFTNGPDFTAKMQVAFGEDFLVGANDFQQDWTVPQIEIRDGAEIAGANGAYAGATHTIYMSREFLDSSSADAASSVLLEEMGHAIDWQFKDTDAPGDEGAIFSALVRGESLDEGRLSRLKVEDDSATVVLDGELVEIELDWELPEIDLEITSDLEGSDRFEVGDTITYTLEVTNHGPNTTVEPVTLISTLPRNLKFQSASIPVVINEDEEHQEKDLTLDLGVMASGSSKTVTIDVIPTDSSSNTTVMNYVGYNLLNIAYEKNMGNNDNYTSITVIAKPPPDTAPLQLEAYTNFLDTNKDGKWETEFDSTIYIGRTDGIDKLLRVQDATAEYDDNELTISGIVYSEIGDIEEPLFQGTFTIPFNPAITTSFEENPTDLYFNDTNGFYMEGYRVAGMDVDFYELTLEPDKILLGSNFQLPADAGGSIVKNALSIDRDGAKLEGFIETVDNLSEDEIINSLNEGTTQTGNNKNNRLKGSNRNDILDGKRGNDKLYGQNGDDTLIGGGGKDLLNGGNGDDTYQLNAKNAKGSQIIDTKGEDTLELNNATISLDGLAKGKTGFAAKGTNLVIDINKDGKVSNRDLTIRSFFADNKANKAGKGFIETVGNVSGDAIIDALNPGIVKNGNNKNNRVKGSNRNDILDGKRGNDKLYGQNGDDILTGGGGKDILYGGSGNDTYKLNAKNAKGSKIIDTKGEDTLELNNATISLDGLAKGKTGFAAVGKNLVIDINKDGKANNRDLTIRNFFASNKVNKPGKGFIETVDNVSGDDILAALGNDSIDSDATPISADSEIPQFIADLWVEKGFGGMPQIGFELGCEGEIVYTWEDAAELLRSLDDAPQVSLTVNPDLIDTSNIWAINQQIEELMAEGSDEPLPLYGLCVVDVEDSSVNLWVDEIIASGEVSDFLTDSGEVEVEGAIADFITGQADQIYLPGAEFPKLDPEKDFAEQFAVVGSDEAAATSDAYIAYNSNNGNLFSNANGNKAGFGAGGQLAALEGAPELDASDFNLV